MSAVKVPRAAAILVAILSVLLAGWISTWEFGDKHEQRVHAVLGEWGELGPGEKVKVESVRVGSRLAQQSSRRFTSENVYVVAKVTIERELSTNPMIFRLRTGKAELDPESSLSLPPDAGYQSTVEIPFEIGVDHLEGATLVVRYLSDLWVHERVVLLDLGLTPDKVRDLLAKDRYATVQVMNPETKAIR